MRRFAQYDLIPLLSVAAVCTFPCVFLYAMNAAEVPASSMIPFLLVFHVNALLFLGITSVFFRNLSRAAFWTDAAMLVVINFGLLSIYVKKLMPWFRDRYQLLFLGILLLALFIYLLKKKPDMRTACLLVAIAFGAMILMNVATAIPAILQSHEVREDLDRMVREEEFPDTKKPENQVFTGETPNVYFFLFDEYGGYYNLQQYYDFDNEPFLTGLKKRGFSVSYDSRNTEAVATDTIVPNLLNLDYVVKVEESGHKKAVFRNNTQLVQMFTENGYNVNLINHVDYLGTAGCRVLTEHQTRRTISEYLMRNSIYQKSAYLRRLLDEFFVSDYGANYRESLDNALEQGLSCWQETDGTPTLTIGYIQCPHSPTMVGRHGEELPFATGWNWRDHSLYLNQLLFMNDYILELVDTIQGNDPGSMIFLMSDHGNRYAIHMLQVGEWTEYDPHEENQYMQNILNCVYYKGQTFDIEGMTGINTMRYMFTEVLGADLPPIEPVQDYSYDYDDEQG